MPPPPIIFILVAFSIMFVALGVMMLVQAVEAFREKEWVWMTLLGAMGFTPMIFIIGVVWLALAPSWPSQ